MPNATGSCFNAGVTPDQVHIIRRTFSELTRHEEVAALVFYKRLFELDPALRPLFKGDIREQAKKLMEMMAILIAMLESPHGLELELRVMGERHAGYGVKDEHYATVAHALLDMLAATLDGGLTPEVRTAWTTLYGAVETAMKAASKPQTTATAP